MYPKKKKHHPWAVVFTAICVAVIIGAGFLLITDTELSFPTGQQKPAYEPVVIAGNIRAFTLPRAALDNTLGEPSREAHSLALDSVLDYAMSVGHNAVLYEPLEGEEFYSRISAGKAAEYIKNCDKLFNKWDPMAYFCEGAAARGLAVFALYTDEQAANDFSAEIEKKYTVSGSFLKQADSGTYTGLSGEGVLISPNLHDSYYSVLQLSETEGFSGFVTGEYGMDIDAQTFSLWASMENELSQPTPLGFTALSDLSLTYPVNTNASIYTKTCFIMGTSNPDLPLTINGEEITRNGTTGAFGYLVELKSGANEIVLKQNERELAFTLTRKSYSGGGTTGIKNDGTVSADEGQMIEIINGIASALSDPDSDGAISDTFKLGSRAIVTESVRTMRSGKRTWAYKLASGDYVLARNTKILDSAENAAFSGTSVQPSEYGEIIAFSGTGTPAAYTALQDNKLIITMLDTDISDGFAVEGSEFVSNTSVKKEENGATTLEFTLTEKPLWGWDIRYENGTTSLFLKYAPVKSNIVGRPLDGVRIMLDAGHGEDDIGAMGVAGQSAPNEKDVNLAVTLSAKYYLEKMGATVLLTREDDTFKTLDERLAAQSEHTPDFFVSVHHNSVELTVDANQSTGTECYYFYNRYSPFAQKLSENVSAASARNNRGEKYGYYYVTRTNVAPSVLLEVGFMVNPLEYEAITNDEIIAKSGESIAMAVFNSVL